MVSKIINDAFSKKLSALSGIKNIDDHIFWQIKDDKNFIIEKNLYGISGLLSYKTRRSKPKLKLIIKNVSFFTRIRTMITFGLFLSFKPPSNVLYISMIAVSKTERGKGIGTNMLNKILEIGNRLDKIRKIGLHVVLENEKAIKLYKKLGFEEIKTDYFDDTMQKFIGYSGVIYMEKPLEKQLIF